ncbi:hypothetical protein BH11PLA1_BH11PLA1_00900 [soil metagenome]
MLKHPDHDRRLVIIAPTFNHAATLAPVLEAVAALGHPLIAVDDGATDATAEVLHELSARLKSQLTILRHPTNQGKAAALRTGFAAARARGCTHAATIDTDGQHDPSDLGALIAASVAYARALVVGVRGAQICGDGGPLASRAGRAVSNVLVRLEAGVRTGDTQSGMRVYPLAADLERHVRARRFGFETEIIARCGWGGTPVVDFPIRSIYAVPGGRVSHFCLVRDSLRAVAMHARLLALAPVRHPTLARAIVRVRGPEHALLPAPSRGASAFTRA